MAAKGIPLTMTTPRIGPRHPRLGRFCFRATRRITTWLMSLAGFHANDSDFTKARISAIRAKLVRGETVYLAGLGLPGTHNSGVALVEVTQAHGPRLIVNNEEERFSGDKHTTQYPRAALEAMRATLQAMGRDIADIDAWLTSWDYPDLTGTLVRSVVEEFPDGLKLLRTKNAVSFDSRRLEQMTRTPKLLRKQFGLPARVPLMMMPHHDNHAWFSFAASPLPDAEPVAIAVLDGTGDLGSVSTYVAHHGAIRKLFCNNSVFDSLGAFYSVIASTQGGWTWLSCEGRYMGAAAWGDGDRATNPFYAKLKDVLVLGDNGAVHLNRDMANWYCDPFEEPYKQPLIDLLGAPLTPAQLWNPDAVLRVEDIAHRPDTQERLDKASATQMVFEDALIHTIDHLLRTTGAHRLVLSGGVALNAIANMRLLGHFNADWFKRELNRDATLHLWVPPVPGDPGVTIGTAWLFAHLVGSPRGEAMTHAFHCGTPSPASEIAAALRSDDIASQVVGEIATDEGRAAVAELMALIVAQGGIIALFQGAAETGPRALGHRSILANPCDPGTRDRLNARVKYREAIRPLAPMATLEAAQRFFALEDGASDDGYNAYNYMVLTARAKPEALDVIPAVIHADGTGRIQIVRADSDPLTHAYLRALGRRIGVEVSVNTSFNVGGPIAQTPMQAIDTLRRATDLDVVLMIADDGTVTAAWQNHVKIGGERDSERFMGWLREWRASQP